MSIDVRLLEEFSKSSSDTFTNVDGEFKATHNMYGYALKDWFNHD